MTLNKKKNGLSEVESDINHKSVPMAYKWTAAQNCPRPYREPPHDNAQRAHEHPAPRTPPTKTKAPPQTRPDPTQRQEEDCHTAIRELGQYPDNQPAKPARFHHPIQ